MPNGVLPLPSPDAEGRREDRVEVGVLDDQRAAGEIGIQIELEAPGDPPPQVRAQPADGERVGERRCVVVRREPAVGVQEQADLQTIVAIGRLDCIPS